MNLEANAMDAFIFGFEVFSVLAGYLLGCLAALGLAAAPYYAFRLWRLRRAGKEK